MSNSYYKNIDGKNYDREMLEIADEAVAGVGDGRISLEDAQKLLGAVKDANKYTDIEKATMKFIRENYRFTYASDQWFRKEIRKWAAKKGKDNDVKTKTTGTESQTEFISSQSYYRVIDGKQYVRSLLEAADVKSKINGLISEENFQQIIELSRDGKGITETEMLTLEYIGIKYDLTTKARLWFEENLEQIRNEVIISDKTSDINFSKLADKEKGKAVQNEQLSEKKSPREIYDEQEKLVESDTFDNKNTAENDKLSEKKSPREIYKEQKKLVESDTFDNKKPTNEYQRPIINSNHQKNLLLVNVLWAALLLISIITVRSIFIDQVAVAEQNLEKMVGVKQNNKLLEERLKTIQLENTKLESMFEGLEQSLTDQIMKQKKLEGTFSLQKTLAKKETKPEVIVFKPDQNNCCFCSCENSSFEESLNNFR